MAIKRVYFVFGARHALYQLLRAVGPLYWISVPCQRGRGTIEFRKAVDAILGVVG